MDYSSSTGVCFLVCDAPPSHSMNNLRVPTCLAEVYATNVTEPSIEVLAASRT